MALAIRFDNNIIIDLDLEVYDNIITALYLCHSQYSSTCSAYMAVRYTAITTTMVQCCANSTFSLNIKHLGINNHIIIQSDFSIQLPPAGSIIILL